MSDAVEDWFRQAGHVKDDWFYIYIPEDIDHATPNMVMCYCTEREALELLVKDSGIKVVWEWHTAHSFVLAPADDGYCYPEMGERAPLPPCKKRKERNYVQTRRLEGYLGQPDYGEDEERTVSDRGTVRSPMFRYDTTVSDQGNSRETDRVSYQH